MLPRAAFAATAAVVGASRRATGAGPVPQSGKTSRYRGVSFHNKGGGLQWRARCCYKDLGSFTSEVEAARAYNAEARRQGLDTLNEIDASDTSGDSLRQIPPAAAPATEVDTPDSTHAPPAAPTKKPARQGVY